MEISYRRLLPLPLRNWLRNLVVDCAMPDCRGFHLSHRLLSRVPGIFIDQKWYCTPACLHDALKLKVEAQLASAITDLRLPPRMPFRLVLVAAGTVTEEQLAHARRVHASGEGGNDVGEALVSLGYVSEDEVAVARAVEAGCLYYGGSPQVIAPANALPRSFMELHHAAPVHYSPLNQRILLGFVYRIDRPLLQAFEQVVGCKVEPCIITRTAWEKQLSRLPEKFEEIHQAAFSQSRIVGMIVKHAISCSADKVSMGLSSNSIWARLAGSGGARDLIIDLAAEGALRAEQIEEEVRRETVREDREAVPAAAVRAARPAAGGEFPILERRSATL